MIFVHGHIKNNHEEEEEKRSRCFVWLALATSIVNVAGPVMTTRDLEQLVSHHTFFAFGSQDQSFFGKCCVMNDDDRGGRISLFLGVGMCIFTPLSYLLTNISVVQNILISAFAKYFT